MSFSRDVIAWRKERRICSEDVFDIYFVLGTPKGEVSQSELQQFINSANQPDEIIILLKDYEKNGKISRLLDWLDSILDELGDDGIFGFCQALMKFGDDLPRISKGISNADTDTQIALLIFRALKKIQKHEDRFQWTLEQIKDGPSLFTITQFVSWNLDEDGTVSSSALFNENQLDILKKTCVEKIETFASQGKLIKTKDISYILNRWKEWVSDEKKILEFVDNSIKTPKSALEFITSFVWESSSYTFGDHVEKRNWALDSKSLKAFVNIDKLTKIVSPLLEKDETKFSDKQQLALKLYFEDVNKREFSENKGS